MRKAFNFYRSYFDVAKELNDKDRLSFYDALMTRQFTGVELKLEGMAKFAYISQKFNIDSQVIGYQSKTNTTLGGSVGGCLGGSVGGSVQGKEKEEGKEKEKEETTVKPPTPKGESIDFDLLLVFYNKVFKKKTTIISAATRKKYNSILKQGYTKDNISKAMVACAKDTFHIENNYKYCSLDYFTRVKTIDMHGFEAPTVKPVNIGVTMAELNNPNLDV